MRSWDTSGVVKLYVQEPDSALFQRLAANGKTIFVSVLVRLEAATVFRRREAEGVLSAGEARRLLAELDQDIARGRIRTSPIEEMVARVFVKVLETCFSEVPPLFVRTNDALHVAAASHRGSTDFVSADARQRKAAQLMGLTVLP